MRAAFLLVPVLILFTAPPQAYSQLPPVEEGDRVRVQLSRQSGAEAEHLVGQVVAVTLDSLSLRIHPDASPVSVAISSVKRLERSRGVRPIATRALQSGALAGFAGAIQMPHADLGNDDAMFGSVGSAALVGAAIGTGLGIIMGAILPQEQWEHLPLANEPAPGPDLLRHPRVAVTRGWGRASGAGGTGEGAYTRLGVGLARLGDAAQLRGELTFQQSALEGAPFTCARASREYCLGTEDATRRYGAGITAVIHLWRIGKFAQTYAPFGLGVMHSRIAREEVEGCIVGGRPASCADGPSLDRIHYTRTAIGASVNSGLGIAVRVGAMNAFIELRGQMLDEDASEPAQFSPVAIGVSF